MKHIALGLIVAFAAITARSQTTTSAAAAPNPQYLNNIYYWTADSLLALEKTTGLMKNKMKVFGVGSSGPSYSMDGPHSPVRIKAGADTRFAVRLNGMMDPSSMIKLFRLDAGKKNRETSATPGNKNLVDCNVQKSGSDVFIFIPTTRLTPGEYGFQNMMMMNGGGMSMSYTFFAFGVD